MSGSPDTHTPYGIFKPHTLSVYVGVGEIAFAEHPARLLTPALGSCVGVAIWDPYLRTGVLGHVMLPAPVEGSAVEDAKYASFAVPKMVGQMIGNGSSRRRLQAKIAGGAAMFSRDSNGTSIGDRNVNEVKWQLVLMRVALMAEDTGQGHARTIELLLDTGGLLIHSHRYGTHEI